MTMALGTGETLVGTADAAAKVTVTIDGDEVAATNTFKKLYQGQPGNTATTLYTVPAATSAIVKHITIANPDASAHTIALYRDGSAAANAILPATSIPAGGYGEWNGSGWQWYDGSGRLLTATPASLTGSISGSPTASAPGDTGADGASGTAADSAHRHAREAWGAAGDIGAETFGATADAGATGKTADAGHVHALPSEVTDLTAAETDTGLRLAPDGAGGVEWATGGTGGPSLPIDAAAAAAVGSGDLFAGTTLDGGWSALQSTALTNVDRSIAGWCILENSGTTSNQDRGLQRAFSPAGDFTVYAKIGALTLAQSYMWAGIFIGAADPSDGASGHRLNVGVIFAGEPNFIATKVDAGSRTDYLVKVLNDSTQGAGAQNYFTLPFWLRIRRSGSTIYAGISWDGVKFYENSTTTTIAFTVATCGILIAENSATYPIRASFNYIATTG